ncbi:MAG: SHOCT domain-containing protein [Thaumarchaeota archaeon]|nr:SHOCT domain-containing protein [Nitrososphaerota archaeon]
MSGFPIKGSINYDRKDVNLNIDEQRFAKQINKIITVGKIRRQKYVVICDGQGTMGFDLLQSKKKQIEDMVKLRDEGHITHEEFKRVKQKILGIADVDSM